MKSILCFGDSLTFGANPQPDGARHAHEDRWPGALEAAMVGKARVIAEGLGGRTTVYDDWGANADRNGARILPTLLASHAPLDLIVIMLGTNDIKPSVCGSAREASFGMRRLIQIVRGHFASVGEPIPKILIVSPPLVCASDNADMMGHFGGYEYARGQSLQFGEHYRRRADEEGVAYFDAASVAVADPADGVHLDAANTKAIGAAIVPLVTSLLDL
ncbi:SGNH/GDSL hydrolase family protein [Devosia rhodophyticola]|uniref:SGNH/GDSL hydrolase family protein n=1 Tax=Devosia rhodophyticola TaxID=3026423 RepID=A0ABY7YX24_9HYPH|nr:SGNH/GDSL hydrolase family protein [Devosia rhodophyticola]WDR05791.1 SGNH/GDSL hydrolase family protein [Devosia rhodophyticola]